MTAPYTSRSQMLAAAAPTIDPKQKVLIRRQPVSHDVETERDDDQAADDREGGAVAGKETEHAAGVSNVREVQDRIDGVRLMQGQSRVNQVAAELRNAEDNGGGDGEQHQPQTSRWCPTGGGRHDLRHCATGVFTPIATRCD